MTILAFDIETLPLASALAQPYPADERTPPANYKNPEAIERWRADDEARWREGLVKKCSLSPRLGRVCAVGYKYGDNFAPYSETAPSEETEEGLLQSFWATMRLSASSALGDILLTWNGLHFDIPFILTRSAKLGIKPTVAPDVIASWRRRYSYFPHCDVKMAVLNWPSGYEAGEGLSEWSQFYLNDPPKTTTGSDVYAMAQAGQWDAIGAYAADDARRTLGIFEKIAPYLPTGGGR